ncbi:MAG: hypothetical protein F6K65_16540 [Moorea sp. SIO3C2]|nr:hypothetical protein [Moorena sp. SIO3C2]
MSRHLQDRIGIRHSRRFANAASMPSCFVYLTETHCKQDIVLAQCCCFYTFNIVLLPPSVVTGIRSGCDRVY